MTFPLLFKPGVVGNIQLKNRLIMGSMHTGFEEDRKSYDRLAAFYRERAEGGVGLIVTGGFAPNRAGQLTPFAATLNHKRHLKRHDQVTQTVHDTGSHIVLQILHAGRYGFHPWLEAPSPIKSPISPFKPWGMRERRIQKTIDHFVRCACLAQEAGYDGVEVMGSEGYLINEFLVTQTNQRHDAWGGDFTHRMRFPVEIIRRMRLAVGPDFIIIYRLSMLDLIEQGSSWDEVVQLAQAVEAAGASMINTGIGWHEARIPTIASMVPSAAFAPVTRQLKAHVMIPVIASNRINTPALAEALLQEGVADYISMARPFLADPALANKALRGQTQSINVCIACNQACLDQVFAKKTASCLVNPRAGRETELQYTPANHVKKVAVVGAGPAGLACAHVAALRGHRVVLFEKNSAIGGQFNEAKQIPGKEDYQYTIDYFRHELTALGVEIHLMSSPSLADLQTFDEIVLATGVSPRIPIIPGIEHPSVMTYSDVLSGRKCPQGDVAVIGAGGIGFDVAEWLTHEHTQEHPAVFYAEWGIDIHGEHRGGIKPPSIVPSPRQVYLLQRKDEKMGQRLGKTTGWIHRLSCAHKKVQMLSGVHYVGIDDEGLHIDWQGQRRVLAVGSIILCAGQIEQRALYEPLQHAGCRVHIVGGALKALELDARTAIEQACRVAAAF